MKTRLALSMLVVLAASTLTVSLAADRWLHVRVEEHRGAGEKVSVNIPLSLVEAILPAIDVDEFHDGRIDIGHEIDDFDLRKALAALRDAPDAEYVRVESDDESVRVAKEDGTLIVLVDEDNGDRVRVRLPLEVVDALLGAGEHELDISAALAVLSDYGGDIVTVESDDESVRVWIDSNERGD